MDIQFQATLIFEKYNTFMEKSSEEILTRESDFRDIFNEEFERDFDKQIQMKMAEFFDRELEGLSDGTPNAFFDSLTTVGELIEVFIVASKVSEDTPPLVLTDRLTAFGDKAYEALIALALSFHWDLNLEDDSLRARDAMTPGIAAVRLLGEKRFERSIVPVLDRYCAITAPDEYLSDTVSEFIVHMGPAVIPELLQRIQEALILPAGGPEEDLVVALASIGSQNRKEEVYQCLRGAFRKMERKVIGVISLGDYGDGRAIPMLKGYLGRSMHEVDRELFYETLTVIRNLGGDITDIEDPFKDFSRK
jgi:hypothetical protein